MSISNKAISYTMQVFRFMNLVVLFTMPSQSLIDKTSRLLLHAYIETGHIDRKKKRVMVKFQENQYNPKYGKIYNKYYKKGRDKIKRVYIKMPSKELIKAYENKKTTFAKELNISVQTDITNAKERKKGIKKITNSDYLDTPDVDWDDTYDIMARCECSQQKALMLKRFKKSTQKDDITHT